MEVIEVDKVAACACTLSLSSRLVPISKFIEQWISLG